MVLSVSNGASNVLLHPAANADANDDFKPSMVALVVVVVVAGVVDDVVAVLAAPPPRQWMVSNHDHPTVGW